MDPALGDDRRAHDVPARLEAPLGRAGDRVQRVEALAAGDVDVPGGDQHRLHRGPRLGGDPPPVPAVRRVQRVHRAEVVGEVHPAARHGGARHEGGRAEEDRRRLEVPVHVAVRHVDRQHPRAGGHVHAPVGGVAQPYRDAPAGGRVADRVRPPLLAGAHVQGAQPGVLPDVGGALVQRRSGLGGLEVGLCAVQLPQPAAGGRLPRLDAAAARAGEHVTALGLQRVHPGLGGQPPQVGAVTGVEGEQGGTVGGVDAPVGDLHRPGDVAGLEAATPGLHVEGVHLEGGDVDQVVGHLRGAPDVVGHPEAPWPPAAPAVRRLLVAGRAGLPDLLLGHRRGALLGPRPGGGET